MDQSALIEIKSILEAIEAKLPSKEDAKSNAISLSSIKSNLQQMNEKKGGYRSRRLPGFESNYKIATGMVYLQYVVGVVLALLGAYVALKGYNTGGIDAAFGMLGGSVMFIGGFATIGMAQITKSLLDTADHSREILSIIYSNL